MSKSLASEGLLNPLGHLVHNCVHCAFGLFFAFKMRNYFTVFGAFVSFRLTTMVVLGPICRLLAKIFNSKQGMADAGAAKSSEPFVSRCSLLFRAVALK